MAAAVAALSLLLVLAPAGTALAQGAATAEAAYPYPAVGVAVDVLRSDGRVRVTETEGAWRFAPAGTPGATVALVLCPGGGVDPLAYAPLARRVAESGFRAYLVRFGPPRGRPVEGQKRDGVAQIKSLLDGEAAGERRTVVAGHSLGGAIAARFVHEHPGRAAGLALAGTTHPRDFDLSGFGGPVTKVYGTLDGVAPPGPTRKNRALLPAHTRWVAVEGGNHAQFGWYGAQPGDRPATLSRREQQAILLRELIALLRKAGQPAP